MPTCLVIQHADPERTYGIGDALTEAGVVVATVRPYAGDSVPPDLHGVDGLVVMGGSMSARSDAGFPTRVDEIALLASAVERGVPTLGICLGAQLLAAATGGTVHRGEVGMEVGWAPVFLSPAAAADPLFAGVDGPVEVLHWHGDTYDPPPTAVHLASSASYTQQAFRVGPRAWGLQFHLEVDAGAVEAFTAGFPGDLTAAGTSAAAVVAAAPAALAALTGPRSTVLGRFAALVADAPRP